MPNIWYKNKETDTIWWKDDPTVIGVWIFSFDKTTEFNMFHDYPYKLTKEQKQIFDKENPDHIDRICGLLKFYHTSYILAFSSLKSSGSVPISQPELVVSM